MSSGLPQLALNSSDAKKLLAAKCHLGNINCNFQMAQYVYNRAQSGANILNIQKMWEKIYLAARIIAAVDNPSDVCIIGRKEISQRAVLKMAKFCGASSIAGRFSPGTFTNHSQAGFREPRLIIITDPSIDHQPVREASYVNIPVIALCDVDTPLKYVDVAIPCNNRAPHSIGLVYYLLSREVQKLKGVIPRTEDWSVMPDLFFHRNAEDIKKQEEEEKKVDEPVKIEDEPEPELQEDGDWNEPAAAGAAQEQANAQPEDWSADNQQANWAAENDWNATAQTSEWS